MSSAQPQQQAKTTLTLSELERDSGMSVFVVNKSDPKGNINFSVSDGMGGIMVVRVPVTWVPIDLTTQATKEAIIKSPHFRKLVSTGMLGIVSEAHALDILSKSDAQKEARRVSDISVDANLSAPASVPAEALQVQEEALGNISGFVMNLANNTDISEEDAMTQLRGQESTMTQADFQYLAQVSPLPGVKEYAASKVNAMQQ